MRGSDKLMRIPCWHAAAQLLVLPAFDRNGTTVKKNFFLRAPVVDSFAMKDLQKSATGLSDHLRTFA